MSKNPIAKAKRYGFGPPQLIFALCNWLVQWQILSFRGSAETDRYRLRAHLATIVFLA